MPDRAARGDIEIGDLPESAILEAAHRLSLALGVGIPLSDYERRLFYYFRSFQGVVGSSPGPHIKLCAQEHRPIEGILKKCILPL
jgi:hypothetical protein